MFITDSSGNKSLTATIATVGFAVVMLKLLLSGVEFTIGSGTYNLGSISAAEIAAVLTPTLGSYTARRWGTPASATAPPPAKLPGEDDNADVNGGRT